MFTALCGCTSHVDETPRLIVDLPTAPYRERDRVPPYSELQLPIAAPAQSAVPRFIIRGRNNAQPYHQYQADAGNPQAGAGFQFNFDNADIRDVLKAVLGDMLQINYTVDASVQGTISIHTANGIPRSAVLPSLEDALKVAGVALVQTSVGIEAVPLQGAAKRARLVLQNRASPGSGYRVEIVPLKYVAATEMQHVLEPIVDPSTIVQVDSDRNTIVLAGTSSELARIDDTISMFDVDWLRSQSFGLFPMQYSQAKTVAVDLESVIGSQGSIASLVKIVPIEHLNAILVVSSRESYVEEMREWIERFDRGRNSEQPRLFVYRVQNGRAADLANVLTHALSARGGSGGETGVAESGPNAQAEPAAPSQGLSQGGAGSPSANPLLGGTPSASDSSGVPFSDVRVTADETNNALMIVTTPNKFSLVEAALRQLDTVPLQVLLEACVAEVHLTNNLQYGLQYYFHNGNFSTLQSAVAPGSLGLATGGLSLAFLQGNDIQGVLNLIASITTVKVVSAPKLMVLNNHTASIDVGDQVPVATSSAVGVTTANAPIVNTIQQVDTGIILHVTPRVNASGLVIMDVNQEVSSTVPTTSSSIDSPTIQQRKVSSSIAVSDGQTIAFGGLISDTRTRSRSGIPWLMDLPYVGALFSLKSDNVDRTELIVLMTPHVIHDALQAQSVTDELRDKLPLIRDLVSGPRH